MLRRDTKKSVTTVLIWTFCIPYNLMLLFGPLAVLRLLLNMTGFFSCMFGLVIGCLLILTGGLFPKISNEKTNKCKVFVEHIEKHLKQMSNQEKRHGKVMCKICMKDIDEIYEEDNGSS